LELNLFTPAKSLQPAHRAQSIRRDPIELFKKQFNILLQQVADAANESEEHLKNIVADFLKNTWYRSDYYINTRDRQDLVIHIGKTAKDPVGVILEVKRPSNRSEMVTAGKPNAKALHELLLYYLKERTLSENRDIKRLIITNIDDWFIFDAADFERHIYDNKKLLQNYNDWREGRLGAGITDWFYKEIATPFFEKEIGEMPAVHFRLDHYAPYAGTSDIPDTPDDDEKLLDLYKILSPEYLLKKPFANDSNALNKTFYEELLYIIGLEEEKIGGKKLINRAKKRRTDGSLLENTLSEIEISGIWRDATDLEQFGDNAADQRYSIALELCITWLNRILFLKLLEGQLKLWTGSNALLTVERVKDYDELNELFFHVLAVPEEQRRASVKEKFGNVPFLNSSLFEQTELERRTLRVSALKDRLEMPLSPTTVLKDSNGKRQQGNKLTLLYLFEFLNAYDFSSDSHARVQEDNKDIINASVLGLIFEKINGYKDGSFFTPGFITMYMCRETIRRTVVQKFNERYQWDCSNLEIDLYNRVDRIDLKEANALVNSIRICDPAVGSGHFLVSALNELIAVKSDLGILCDPQGRKLRELRALVGNDELLVTHRDTDLPLQYQPGNAESQRIQESIFHEKQTLIENCLFGVDINPKSVMICRLRLWIELLKHAYFTAESKYRHLETLPNIDINIKSGNSLISRFALDEDLKKALQKSNWSIEMYKMAVKQYHHASNKDEKMELEQLLLRIKNDFRSEIGRNDPKITRLQKLSSELYHRFTGNFLFEPDPPEYGGKKRPKDTLEQKREEEKTKLEAEINKLQTEIDAIKSNKIFKNAFEWRFEFPEVLDDTGSFVGFDVVVGNPPYIRQEELAAFKGHFQQHFETFSGTADLYVYFVERAMKILRKGGQFSYILPNKWMRAGYGDKLRQYTKNFQIMAISDFGDLPVFEEATTYPCVFEMKNSAAQPMFQATNIKTLDFLNGMHHYIQANAFSVNTAGLQDSGWTLTDQTVQNMLEKIRAVGKPLREHVDGKIYYGIKTGLNEAFVIDAATRDRLIAEDAKSAEVIKPFLSGRDIKRYQVPSNDKYLILFEKGVTNLRKGTMDAEKWLVSTYPSIAKHLKLFEESAKKRTDKGDFWWELRACDYYKEFEEVKILYQVFQVKPCFIYDEVGFFCNNAIWIIPNGSKNLCALLNSKLGWYLISSYCTAIQNGYQLIFQYFGQIPIPPNLDNNSQIEALVTRILAAKQADPQADTSLMEAEIDQLVYGLYGLGEAEIKILEAR
jgi:hypothetical protein